MTENTTVKKTPILTYNLLLYLLLLVIETGNNVFFSLSSAKTGKVLSSLYGNASSIFLIIWPEAIRYIITVLAIYITVAWVNSNIINKLSVQLNNKCSCKNAEYISVGIFFLVNGLFLSTNYFFVSLLYPGSHQDILSFPDATQGNLPTYIFYIFSSCYFITAYWSIPHKKTLARYGFVALLFLTISYNVWPITRHYASIAPDNKKNKGPNVIIIGIDSLRPDHLVRNGYSQMVAPNVEHFLDKSIVFTNAYTPLARTFPSWMSILTGKTPPDTGIRYNLIQRHYYTNDQPTINQLLKKEYGYYTVHAMDETRFCNLTPDDGFNELMHPITGVVDFLFGRMHDYSLTNLYFNNRTGGLLFPFIKNNRAIARLYDGKQFVHDIENKLTLLRDRERFFFAVHLCAAHWPYKLRGIEKGSRKSPLTPQEQYVSAITMADKQLGFILEAIKKNGFYDNSIIILLSDHGESFESNWGHGTTLYEDNQNHIMLGVKPAGFNGQHTEETRLVSTIDIAPTVIDLLDIKTGYDIFPGKSLLKKEQHNKNRPVYMETGFHLFHSFGKSFTINEMINAGAEYYDVSPINKKIIVKDEYHQKIIDTKQFAILTDKWRLIAQKDINNFWKVDLFDFKDKQCSENLSNQLPLIVRDLSAKLSEHFSIDISINNLPLEITKRQGTPSMGKM